MPSCDQPGDAATSPELRPRPLTMPLISSWLRLAAGSSRDAELQDGERTAEPRIAASRIAAPRIAAPPTAVQLTPVPLAWAPQNAAPLVSVQPSPAAPMLTPRFAAAIAAVVPEAGCSAAASRIVASLWAVQRLVLRRLAVQGFGLQRSAAQLQPVQPLPARFLPARLRPGRHLSGRHLSSRLGGVLLALALGWLLLLDASPALAADLQVSDVRLERCPADDIGSQPDLSRPAGATCYALRGVVVNPTSRPVIDTDVFARILDASGEPVLPNRTRVGSIGDIPPGRSDFALRLAVPAGTPEPLTVRNAKARGFSAPVRTRVAEGEERLPLEQALALQ